MSMDKILVIFFALLLIGFIIWFFFGEKNKAVEAEEYLNVMVSGGYNPKIIKIKKGVETRLLLKRTDPNPCLDEFIISDLKVKRYLPLNKEIEIVLKPTEVGEFEFHCGMNMYHGKLVVE
jgi:plastocyanin domain-containing protein